MYMYRLLFTEKTFLNIEGSMVVPITNHVRPKSQGQKYKSRFIFGLQIKNYSQFESKKDKNTILFYMANNNNYSERRRKISRFSIH